MTRREIPEPTTQLPPKTQDRPMCGIDERASTRIIGWYCGIACVMFFIYIARMIHLWPFTGGTP